MKQNEFIAEYQKSKNIQFNEDLIEGEMRNENLVEYVIDSFKTLEVIKNIELISYKYITDETKFDTDLINYNHVKKSQKKNLDTSIKKLMPIDDSKYGLLKVKFKLKVKDEVKIKTVRLLIMENVDKYCYLLGGNKFYPIYQLVDASTYNNKDYISLKSMLMGINVKRGAEPLIDIYDNLFMIPSYSLVLYKKKVNPLFYYLGLMGYTNMILYMGMEDIISIEEHTDDDDSCYYFKISNKTNLYISVLKTFFDNDLFTQGMVYMIKDALNSPAFKLEKINNIEYWCKTFGNSFTTSNQYDKGKNMLVSFYRQLDNNIKKKLRLEPFNKHDIYAVVRWMLRNYADIKAKDNMDLSNKRIRLTEYVAFYFAKSLAKRVNNLLLHKKNEINMKSLDNLLSFSETELIRQIYTQKSPLLRYDNSTNDMNVFTSLKFSIKGPGSLGEKSSNAIDKKYRGIHHSQLGRLDINSSGVSDPGLTGMISPFCKTYSGGFFDLNREPQNWDNHFNFLYKQYFGTKYTPKKLKYIYPSKENPSIKFLQDPYLFIKNDPYFELEKDKIVIIDKLNLDKKNKKKKSKIKIKMKEEKKNDTIKIRLL